MKALIVVEPFADYAKGDQITDAKEIETVLETNWPQVVPINLPDPPAVPAKGEDTNS